jgi:hypothetical protein
MEILWPTLSICVLVGFVFFVLAQHWQRLLRNQNLTIRRLTERVRTLEAIDDPEFRRRLEESSPSPLEQVFNFSLRLSDRFWRETLKTTAEDLSFIRAFGIFLGSVKIERWRGHTVATISEVLPAGRSAAWQTRSLDCYFEKSSGHERLTLWEVPLARVQNSERPPSLELSLTERSMDLCAHLLPPVANNGSTRNSGLEEIIFFRVPLDSAKLAEFRSHDPLQGFDNGDAVDPYRDPNFWQGFYSYADEDAGFEWQLRVRDLTKKAEWERWKILESPNDLPSQKVWKHN